VAWSRRLMVLFCQNNKLLCLTRWMYGNPLRLAASWVS